MIKAVLCHRWLGSVFVLIVRALIHMISNNNQLSHALLSLTTKHKGLILKFLSDSDAYTHITFLRSEVCK